MEVVLPKLLDYYEIGKYISEGAYGEVYQVTNFSGELYVAKISLSPYENGSLVEEASILGKINADPDSPFLRFLGLFSYHQRQVALVMEYFPGASLSSLQEEPSFDLVYFMASELLFQITYLHEHNLSHGDINPSNILYSPEEERIVLIDFGGNPKSLSRTKIGLSEESWNQVKDLDILKLIQIKDMFDFGLILRWLLFGGKWNSLLFLEEADLTISLPEDAILELLVNQCLSSNIEDRLSAKEALSRVV